MKTPILLLLSCILTQYVAAQQQNRVVLIEQFTNSGCPPCAASTPPVYQFARNNAANTALIAYHTSFPYLDSMHFENPADANARTAFYGVNGVPHSIMDGNHYRAATATFTAQMQGRFNQRSIVPVSYVLTVSELSLEGDSLRLSIQASSVSAQNATDSLRLFAVVVEDMVQKSSYAASPGANSLTSYSFVMRKLLPSASGYPLQNKGMGESDTVSWSWKLQKIKNVAQLRVVVFVQNVLTKEIYQAYISNGIASSVSTLMLVQTFKVFPLPASTYCKIRGADLPQKGWEIRNMFGQKVALLDALSRDAEEITFTLPTLSNGLYFIGNGTNVGFQKLIIQH